jgi:hypothetical protein
MLTHPHNDLDLVHRRGQELRAEAAAERTRGVSPARHALADALRWTANRLDPARLAPPGPDLLVKER